MKKKFKTLRSGMEGPAMTFDLYLDGSLAAHVRNDGNGGDNVYHWVGKYASHGGWNCPAEVQAWVDAQPEADFLGTMLKPNLDVLLEEAIFEAEIARKVATRCKKVVVFSLPTDEKGVLREYKTPYTPTAAAAVRNRYPTAIIYNETLAA